MSHLTSKQQQSTQTQRKPILPIWWRTIRHIKGRTAGWGRHGTKRERARGSACPKGLGLHPQAGSKADGRAGLQWCVCVCVRSWWWNAQCVSASRLMGGSTPLYARP